MHIYHCYNGTKFLIKIVVFFIQEFCNNSIKNYIRWREIYVWIHLKKTENSYWWFIESKKKSSRHHFLIYITLFYRNNIFYTTNIIKFQFLLCYYFLYLFFPWEKLDEVCFWNIPSMDLYFVHMYENVILLYL